MIGAQDAAASLKTCSWPGDGPRELARPVGRLLRFRLVAQSVADLGHRVSEAKGLRHPAGRTCSVSASFLKTPVAQKTMTESSPVVM